MPRGWFDATEGLPKEPSRQVGFDQHRACRMRRPPILKSRCRKVVKAPRLSLRRMGEPTLYPLFRNAPKRNV